MKNKYIIYNKNNLNQYNGLTTQNISKYLLSNESDEFEIIKAFNKPFNDALVLFKETGKIYGPLKPALIDIDLKKLLNRFQILLFKSIDANDEITDINNVKFINVKNEIKSIIKYFMQVYHENGIVLFIRFNCTGIDETYINYIYSLHKTFD